MTEDNENLIQLQDEEGNDVNFEHLMTVEVDGSYYVVLEAKEDTEDCKAGESIILKIIREEGSDEDLYATIEDENEYQKVCDRVEEIVAEEEDEFGTYEEDSEEEHK